MKIIISVMIFCCMSIHSVSYAENTSEVLSKKSVNKLSLERFSNKKRYRIRRESVGDLIAKQNPCEMINVKKNDTLIQQ